MESAQIKEWLETLCTRHSAVAVARAMNVSTAAVSHVRSGRREPTPTFGARLLTAFPLDATVPPQAPKTGAGKSTADAVWLNTSIATVTDLTRLVDDTLDAMPEDERLARHTDYQAMRMAALAVCDLGDLWSALLPVPDTEAARQVADGLATMRGLIDESEVRQSKIDAETKSDLYKRYSQFRESARRKVEKCEKGDDADALMKLGIWFATVTTVCAVLQPLPDERQQVIDAIRPTGPFGAALAKSLDAVRPIVFPCLAFRDDPVGYVQTILGEDPWTVEGEQDQITMLLSVRDHKITIVPAGTGLGKTTAVAWICHWWRDTRPQGRVLITNFTGNQLRSQDWAEIVRCAKRSGICLACRQAGVMQAPCPHSQVIPADEISMVPTTGIWSADRERFILGVTGDNAQAISGYHGEEMLVICDEFAGTKMDMFEVWIHNLVGDKSRFLGPGNCLDGPGSPMHDIVTDARVRDLYHANIVTLSGEVAVRAGKSYLPTIADNKLLEDKDPRGKESPEYQIRVQGRYPTRDEYAVIPAGEIIKCSDPELYKAAVASGPLVVGIDPSGVTEAAHDLGVIVPLRGRVALDFRSSLTWTRDDYLAEVIDLWRTHRLHDTESIYVGIDADGVGVRLIARIQDYLDSPRVAAYEKCPIQLYPIYFGHEAIQWRDYDLTGDEGRALLAKWIHAGGVVPHNSRLIQEMQHLHWHYIPRHRHDQYLESVHSATRKDSNKGEKGFRQVLGRSPDHLDALTVAVMTQARVDLGALPDDRSPEEVIDETPVYRPVDAARTLVEYRRKLLKNPFQG